MLNRINLSISFLYFLIIFFLITVYPIDPVAFNFSIFSIHWYGILFLLTLIICGFKLKNDIKKIDESLNLDHVYTLLLFSFSGMIIGARLIFVLFYQFDKWHFYLQNPIQIINLTNGGLSFHGGLIGLICGVILFCKKFDIKFLKCIDMIALTAPIGLAEGRLGNFINGELWGKETDSFLGIVFQNAGLAPRHPTQLYEGILEGVVLFFILKYFSKYKKHDGFLSGMFLIFYSIFRFLIEFVREPDYNIGYLAFDWLTMGQILCMPMFVLGMALVFQHQISCINLKKNL